MNISIAIIIIALCYITVGTMDYNDQINHAKVAGEMK